MENDQFKNVIDYMLASKQFSDRAEAEDVLRASLLALRDRLNQDEAHHLGTLLPASIQSVYFENWETPRRQSESVNKSEFLAEVKFHLEGRDEIGLDDLVPVALKAIVNLISKDEGKVLKHSVPNSLRNIFNDDISM